MRAAKFHIVDDYYYGKNDPLKNTPKDSFLMDFWENRPEAQHATTYDDLVVYRGMHICNSKTFKLQFIKMFNNEQQVECDKLMNLDVFKIKKIKHQERYDKFLNRFKDEVKRFAHEEYKAKKKVKLPAPNTFDLDFQTPDRPEKKPRIQSNT